MAVDLFVVRGAGDQRGPDIVDGLLSDPVVAIIRGAAEINDSTPTTPVTLTTNYRAGVRKGHLAQVLDATQGVSWVGKIVGVSHISKGADVWTELVIERPEGGDG